MVLHMSIWGCLKSRLLSRQPVEFKIKSLYYNDLILNVAHKIKEAVQKLKFLDSPVNDTQRSPLHLEANPCYTRRHGKFLRDAQL